MYRFHITWQSVSNGTFPDKIKATIRLRIWSRVENIGDRLIITYDLRLKVN